MSWLKITNDLILHYKSRLYFLSYANSSTPLMASHDLLHALYENNVADSRLSLKKVWVGTKLFY